MLNFGQFFTTSDFDRDGLVGVSSRKFSRRRAARQK